MSPSRERAAQDRARADAISLWLIQEGRLLSEPTQLVATLVAMLADRGVHLWRVRIGQHLMNPLLSAWGVIWEAGSGAREYLVERHLLRTAAYFGSPFEHVIETRTRFRKRLSALSEEDHPVLRELAEAGGSDYAAWPLVYGDGSVQVAAFMTDRPEGFSEASLALLEAAIPALAAALEPFAMRRSERSLLSTYVGRGPAERVLGGRFSRGDHTTIEASILLTDLRGFTTLSASRATPELLEVLDRYFDKVVTAVTREGGDVLKFIGDGVLSIFPHDAGGASAACAAVARAISRARHDLAGDLDFVAACHSGPLSYGNIGSEDRLDFTVVGPSVNLVSRLEALAKEIDADTVASEAFAAHLQDATQALGQYALKGFDEPQTVYRVEMPVDGR